MEVSGRIEKETLLIQSSYHSTETEELKFQWFQ